MYKLHLQIDVSVQSPVAFETCLPLVGFKGTTFENKETCVFDRGTGESAVEITDIFNVHVDEDLIPVFTGQMWNVTGVDNWSGHSFVDKGGCKTLLTSSIK